MKSQPRVGLDTTEVIEPILAKWGWTINAKLGGVPNLDVMVLYPQSELVTIDE